MAAGSGLLMVGWRVVSSVSLRVAMSAASKVPSTVVYLANSKGEEMAAEKAELTDASRVETKDYQMADLKVATRVD